MVARRQRLRTFLNARFAASSEFRTFVSDHFEAALPRIPWVGSLDEQSDAFITWLTNHGRLVELWPWLRAARPLLGAEIDQLASEWSPTPIHVFAAGEVVGRYRLTRRMGSGPIGESWLACDVNAANNIVVKIASTDLSSSPEALIEDLRQIQTMSLARFTTVIDVGIVHDRVFVARSFVDGESLDQLVKREGRQGSEAAAEILSGVARALAGVRHGGLSPANVFLVRDADLARDRDQEIGGLADRVVVTELGFASRLSDDVGTKIDMPALGELAYWLLVGEASPLAAASVRARRRDVSAAFDRLIVRLREPDDSNRPKSMKDVATLLELMAGRHKPVVPTAPAPRGVNPTPTERFVRTVTLQVQGATHTFNVHSIRIGRDIDCDLILDERRVSARHGVLFHEGPVLRYQDTSRNGSTLLIGETRREIAFEEIVEVPLFGKIQFADSEVVLVVTGLGVSRR